jgi:hypothetical protein
MSNALRDAAAALSAAANELEELRARNERLEHRTERTIQLFKELNNVLKTFLEEEGTSN